MKTIEPLTIKQILRDDVLRDFDNNSKDEQLKTLLRELRYQHVKVPVIFVGCGTCGCGAGALQVKQKVEEYISHKNIKAKIVATGCIGLCSVEPIMDVIIPGFNRISLQMVYPDVVESILDNIFALTLPDERHILAQIPIDGARAWDNVIFLHEHPFFKPQKRIVLQNCGIIDPVSIEEYIAYDGYKTLIKVLMTFQPEQVCDVIERSGLRGRGGGGFPTGRKWKLARQTESDQKYLVCNADEGDPGAFMDRAVIEGDPHRLIEGMAIAAYAIGANTAYVYIRAEYPLAIERLEKALEQAKEYGLLGENIFGTGFNLEIKIKKGAGAFVCGEETALMHSIEGKRGMPRPRPPYPVTQGLFGKPTVINNVETLANVPSIIRNGAEWFAATGTSSSKGTKVFALSGKLKKTGLIEIPMGTTIRQIVFDIAGGILNDKKFKAVQIGGPSGGCITEENLDIQIDYESLTSVGAMMGSGGLVVMDEDTCMVDVAKFFMDFIQRESCGKCIPCREGTKRLLEVLDDITSKPSAQGNAALDRFKGVVQLERLCKVIKDSSLCGLGQTAPNPVLSTIRWFRDEYEAHVFERRCPAGVCKNLKEYRINVDKCTGCTVCSKQCAVGAIIGSRKTPHFIVQEKCIGCGACYQACKFEAIEIVS